LDFEKHERLAPIYAAIGQECAAIVGGNPDGLYLYAEAGQGWSGVAVFMNEGRAVRYFAPTRELCALIQEAWDKEETGQPWLVMEYEIHGGMFDANLIYPDEMGPGLTMAERQRDALRRRFGRKAVLYPPYPDNSPG
jgi:hypothetical protein